MKVGTEHLQYIGDGVYAYYDGYHLVLTTDPDLWSKTAISLDHHVRAEVVRLINELDGESDL